MESPEQVPTSSARPGRPQNTFPNHGPASSSAPATPEPMSFNCQSCVRRKVKCDRTVPKCSACVKSKQGCHYQAPLPPRRKKRKGYVDDGGLDKGRLALAEESVPERLERYERLLRQNGLLDAGGSHGSPREHNVDQSVSPLPSDPGPVASSHTVQTQAPPGRVGRLVSGHGKSRYINSHLWLDTGAEEMQDLSEETEPLAETSSLTPGNDPISGALLELSQNLLEFHPSYENAMKLWEAHVNNVEPLCRILHIPTTTKMVDAVARQPSTASKAQECQLFAIYHFAVYSMDDEDCLQQFGQPRSVLLPRYAHAVRQALVNASWLRTTEMPVMQAFMLFLIAGRSYIDPHTYWMLTGIGVRIAQRMGLHRDGEGLGLPPFEVQMRRRLFWQLIPLDGFAGQLSGTGISMLPNTWDVKKPLNINDDQIYPGMTQWPEEVEGATDMIYVLCRVELSEFYSKLAGRMKDNGPSLIPADDASIDVVERTIESKFLRYCDIINPLHYLVLLIVRSAANVVRLRTQIRPLKTHTINAPARRKLCTIAQKILDADNAVYRSPGLKNFRWQVKEFFLWDAVICMLTSLTTPGFFSQAELDATWAKLMDLWAHHPELLETWRPVHVMAGRAILEAWMANPPTVCVPEPDVIAKLKARRGKAGEKSIGAAETKDVARDAAAEFVPCGWDERGMMVDTGIGAGDWVFWDQFFLNAEMSG